MSLWGRFAKRAFDIVFALIGIFFTWWIIVVAIIVASIETKSFGLFMQKRVGKNGKLFNVFKIKTMKPVKGVNTTITTANDMRITKNGKFFRDTKIDELPQLLNVLFGSMSFVGPRPDVEGYADKLEGEDRVILSVRPGITGPASIKYKNEEAILSQQANPKKYNDEVIWVDKVQINKEYIKRWSLQNDIEYILKTLGQQDIWIEFFFQSTNKKRIISFLALDIFISFITIVLSYLLRFNFAIETDYYTSMVIMLLLLTPIKIIIFLIFKVYHVAWRFFGLAEYKQLVFAHFVAYAFFMFIFLLFRNNTVPFPLSVIIIDIFLSIFFIGFHRISKRLYLEKSSISSTAKLLIIGTNSKSAEIIKSTLRGEIDYSPKALVSDDKHTVGTYFQNIPVYNKSSIEKILKELEINSVVITEQIAQKELIELFSLFNRYGIKDIKTVQMFQDDQTSFLDISIEDLLARKPKDLDMISIANYIAGKVIMITGAGGSIGSELSRQVALFGAKQIILLDHSEFNLYQISEELEGKSIISVMLSVKDREALDDIFKQYLPDVVLHAAAYKHVPLCEENVESAVQNNIFGTKNVIDLAVAHDVSKLLLVSTDKAVRPTNVMGTTKRVCELYAHAVPSRNTEIVAVRFGNVLGSSGSVIPKFKAQIEKGQNITVTHPDITRYFMLIPEACQLVLQAASIAKGGELFILDMGEPIKIVDLAKRMIELSGRDDIKIEFTGLRQGEKLYEELLIDEADLKTEYDSIMVSTNPPVDYAILLEQIERLKDRNELKVLKEIVPEFDHKL